MMAPESDVLEYKQDLTETFLKTVSAFGNFHDGDIIFGAADDLTVPDLDHPAQFAESVAHMINDSFSPALLMIFPSMRITVQLFFMFTKECIVPICTKEKHMSAVDHLPWKLTEPFYRT